MTMRAFLQIGSLIAALAIAGCAGSAGSAGSTSMGLALPQQANVTPFAGGLAGTPHVLFVAGLGSDVGIYTNSLYAKNPSPMGTLSQGITRAQGLWVDRHGVLYVSNNTTPPSIVEYQPGASAPFKTITVGLYTPGFIAVYPGGNLYVNDGPAHVLVYAPSAASPTQTIPIPHRACTFVGGLTIDKNSNLLVGTHSIITGASTIYSIAHGSTTVTALNLQGLGGDEIGTDAAGNLYAGGSGGSISVHAPGSTTPSRYINAGTYGFDGGMSVAPNGAIYWANWEMNEMFEFAPGASKPTNIVPSAGGIDAALGLW